MIALLAASSLTLPACGEESGVNGNKPLSTLTADERRRLCDWGASLYGGYGKTTVCVDGSTQVRTNASREDCLSEGDASGFASCAATVSQLEACGRAIHHACTAGGDSAEACQPIRACGAEGH